MNVIFYTYQAMPVCNISAMLRYRDQSLWKRLLPDLHQSATKRFEPQPISPEEIERQSSARCSLECPGAKGSGCGCGKNRKEAALRVAVAAWKKIAAMNSAASPESCVTTFQRHSDVPRAPQMACVLVVATLIILISPSKNLRYCREKTPKQEHYADHATIAATWRRPFGWPEKPQRTPKYQNTTKLCV